MGLWDLGGALLAARGVPLTVLAQEGGDPRFNRVRDEARRRRAIEILWTGAEEGGTAGALVAALARLRENRVVALLADRPTGDPRALERVPFLGREARFPTGAAALARAAGAPILPAFVLLDERTLRYRAVIEPPIEAPRTADRAADHRAATEAWVRVLERWVRAYPEQWYNFYPYWEA
jgi:KDO2-lipid IV(A) lauroyltransferase